MVNKLSKGKVAPEFKLVNTQDIEVKLSIIVVKEFVWYSTEVLLTILPQAYGAVARIIKFVKRGQHWCVVPMVPGPSSVIGQRMKCPSQVLRMWDRSLPICTIKKSI